MRTAYPRGAYPRAAYTKDTMFLKTVLLAIALALLTVVLMAPQRSADAQDQTTQSTNNCAAGEKIDGSTADQAKQKLEAAGYTDVTGLNKGCDNVWHAQARSNGNQVNVMVAADGSVNQETN